MNLEQNREKVIQNLADLLRTNPFTVEFKVVKNPTGIHVIHEVTQEELNQMLQQTKPNQQ